MAKKSDSKELAFLKPRNRSNDEFFVYDKGFLSGTQFDAVKRVGGRREVYLDPESIHRMATLGLSREMIAAYYGITKGKFQELIEDYPELDEAYLMGMSAGMAKAAMSLEKQIESGQCIPTIFRLKTGGWIEADKVKGNQEDSAPRVNIFIPDNGRDRIIDVTSNQFEDEDD